MDIKNGTAAYEVLKFICYVQEYPKQQLHLLSQSSADWTRRLVRRMADAGYLRIRKKEGEPTSIGIRKSGWEQIYHMPYLPGKIDAGRITRLHKLAVTAAVMKNAGVEILPEHKPPLIQSDRSAFWTSKELKAGDMALTRNLNGSRLAGVYATGSDFLAVYSIGSNQMCWSEVLESRTKAILARLTRTQPDKMLLLGETMEQAHNILNTPPNHPKRYLSPTTCYSDMYYIPASQESAWIVRQIQNPYRRRLWTENLFGCADERSLTGSIDCDGFTESKGERRPYLFCFDFNLSRLYRLKLALELGKAQTVVLFCLPWQSSILRQYFGNQGRIIEIRQEALDYEK